MKLWTIQEQGWWENCLKREHFKADRRFQNRYISNTGYKWMQKQMIKRIGPSPNGILWAWYRYRDEKRPVPDLRCGGHLRKGTPSVFVEFEIPECQMLISDFENWHFPLNNWYLGTNRILEKQIDTYKNKEYPGYIQKIIEQSWEKIFRIKKGRPLQATLWEIPLEGITKIKFFIAR